MMSVDEMVGALLSGVARTVSGTSGRWVDCEPSTRQRIYFANHSSHFDIVILWSSLPPAVRRLTRPAAARDYWEKTPFRRYLAHRVFNVIMVDRPEHGASRRAALHSIEHTVVELGSTYSLIIFPEGTRGSGEEIAPFRGGVYHLAKRMPEVELVPVYLENLNRILPKGEVLAVPLLSSISFGAPLRLQADELKRDFLSRAREAVCRLAEV